MTERSTASRKTFRSGPGRVWARLAAPPPGVPAGPARAGPARLASPSLPPSLSLNGTRRGMLVGYAPPVGRVRTLAGSRHRWTADEPA